MTVEVPFANSGGDDGKIFANTAFVQIIMCEKCLPCMLNSRYLVTVGPLTAASLTLNKKRVTQ